MESDHELAVRAAGGDRFAFRDLVERYQGVMLSFGLHLTRNIDEAHRLAREAFVEGFFRSRPAEGAAGWISDVCRIATELYREGKKVKSSSIVASSSERDEEDAGGGKLGNRTMLAISENVHTLPEADRIAVTLKHTNRMASDQIAAATGESTSAVSTRLSRGFKTLRDGLIQRIHDGGISVGV